MAMTKPAAPRQDLWKYQPLVELLEGREAPGNSTLSPTGMANPTFGAGAALLAVTGSPLLQGGGGGSSFNLSGGQYQGYTLGGSTPAPGGSTQTVGSGLAPASTSGASAFSFYLPPSGGGGAGSSGGEGGTVGQGFGGETGQGTGMVGGGTTSGGTGGSSAQDPLTSAVMTAQPNTPAAANAPSAMTNSYFKTNGSEKFWAVKLKSGVDAGVFAASVGGVNYGMGGVTQFSNIFMIKFPEAANAASVQAALNSDSRVVWAEQQKSQSIATKAVPNDEFFRFQWHLRNTAEFGGLPGADANVVPAWDTVQGRGVTIGIVDSGVEYSHEDLQQNYDFGSSFDFTEGDFDAWPRDDDDGRAHGTSVAGVAAGRGFNGIGISGAAPMSQIAGLKLIDGTGVTAFQQAASQSYNRNVTDIYNNSWGKADPDVVVPVSPIFDAALQEGATFGRDGLGNIFVYSAGNSHAEGSEANYHGDRTNQYAITVGSLTEYGTKSGYSEEGANLFVSAYSNGGALGIVTTTTENGYVGDFGGTSSAAPLVSGVIALILEANPNLTWRDVKHIIAQSSRKTDASNPSWTTNAAGLHHSNQYGFGAIDAFAAVELAKTWTNVAPQVTPYLTDDNVVGRTIPQGVGISRSLNIPQNFVVEHVEVFFTAVHANLGQIAMELTSPSGTKMNVGGLVANENEGAYINQRFGFVGYLGEQSQGSWTLRVVDTGDTAPDSPETGQWIRWSMRVHGYIPDGGVTPPPVTPTLSNGSEDARFESNNSWKTAYKFGSLAGNQILANDLAIRSRTDRDWFHTTTTRAGQLTAEITITGNPILHIKIYTYNAKTKKLTEVAKGQGTKLQPGGIQRVTANLSADQQIFIQVYGHNRAEGNYNMPNYALT